MLHKAADILITRGFHLLPGTKEYNSPLFHYYEPRPRSFLLGSAFNDRNQPLHLRVVEKIRHDFAVLVAVCYYQRRTVADVPLLGNQRHDGVSGDWVEH